MIERNEASKNKLGTEDEQTLKERRKRSNARENVKKAEINLEQ